MGNQPKEGQKRLEQLLKEQSHKLPISRLVLPSYPISDVAHRDTSRYITLSCFRTKEYFPNPFYKNISRDLTIPADENY
jgi:hypothetical protein